MSPLKTVTLREFIERADVQCTERDTRFEQNNAELEQQEDPVVRRRLQSRINRARRFIQTLLGQRDSLEQTAYEATEGQVCRFNEAHRTDENYAPWDMQFQLLSELPKCEQADAWEQLPNGVFKRMQECFCAHEHRVLPRNRHLLQNEEFCIDGMILTPECVSDELAAKLGIVKFEESDSPIIRWQKKHDPTAIEALRGLLRGAQQLERRNCRIIVLSDGRILYSSGNGSERKSSRSDKKVQIFDTYSAHRKTHHEHNVYEREIGTLEEVRVKLEGLQPLISSWKRDTPDNRKQEIEAEALPVIIECADQLNAAINIYKRIAGNTLQGIEDFTVKRHSDGRRIVNPPAIMAKLAGVRNNLSRRFAEMLGKGSYNERDGMVLQREIKRSEQIFSMLRARLAQSAPENTTEIAQDRKFHALRNIRTAPFRTYAEKILAIQETHLAPALQDGDNGACVDGLVRAYIITKFQEVHSGFENMKARMLTLEHLQVYDVRQLAEELAKLFGSIDIFPEHTVDEYVQPFEAMRDDLETIRKGLVHYEQQDLDIEGRRALFERFREHLDKFDIEDIVKNLP